jgi:vacuolar-type H+-ATPase subunit F/Vma7
MSEAVAIGDGRRLAGYTLAGAEVLAAATAAEIDAAWERVGDDVRLLVLTREAYDLLAERLLERDRVVWAVLPT